MLSLVFEFVCWRCHHLLHHQKLVFIREGHIQKRKSQAPELHFPNKERNSEGERARRGGIGPIQLAENTHTH